MVCEFDVEYHNKEIIQMLFNSIGSKNDAEKVVLTRNTTVVTVIGSHNIKVTLIISYLKNWQKNSLSKSTVLRLFFLFDFLLKIILYILFYMISEPR